MALSSTSCRITVTDIYMFHSISGVAWQHHYTEHPHSLSNSAYPLYSSFCWKRFFFFYWQVTRLSLGLGSGPETGKGISARITSDQQMGCTQVALNSSGHLYLYLECPAPPRIIRTALLLAYIFNFN